MAGWAPGCGLLLATTLLLSGCGRSHDPGNSPAPPGPAQRIVSLAPGLTELVYTAGAGDRLVAVVEYSDYPAAARRLPKVGDSFRLDFERLAELAPDLILAWESGNPRAVQDRLRELGYRVVALEPATLEDIGIQLRIIGELAGTSVAADRAADAYARRLAELRDRYRGKSTVDIFYQISAHPLFTISGRHVITRALEVCGGRNVFADVEGLSPAVSLEAVIVARPEVIIAGRLPVTRAMADDPFLLWAEWPNIPAVRDGNLFVINADHMHRSSVRILDGIEQLCLHLDEARRKRAQGAG